MPIDERIAHDRRRWSYQPPRNAIREPKGEVVRYGNCHGEWKVSAAIVNLHDRRHRHEMESLDRAGAHFARFEPQHPAVRPIPTAKAQPLYERRCIACLTDRPRP